jgi:hypothetical protein
MSRGWRIFGTGEPQYRAEKITATARLPSPPEDAARTPHSADRFPLFRKAPGEASPKQFKHRVIPLGHPCPGPSGDVPPGAFIAEFAGQSEFAADVPELFAVIVPVRAAPAVQSPLEQQAMHRFVNEGSQQILRAFEQGWVDRHLVSTAGLLAPV